MLFVCLLVCFLSVGCRRVGIVFKFSVLLECPGLFLWLKRADFSGAFLVHTCWHFQIVGFFSSHFGMCEAKRKSREHTTVSFLSVQISYQICLVFPNFQCLRMIILYIMSSIFHCT